MQVFLQKNRVWCRVRQSGRNSRYRFAQSTGDAGLRSPHKSTDLRGPRLCSAIGSGLSRERLGEVGESKRVSKTGLSVFWGETARNAVSTSDHGYRCHVELDAETVRFDYVSITCRLRLVYVSFTCFTAENPLIYLLKKFAYAQFL